MKLEIKQVVVDLTCETCVKYTYLSEEWVENHRESDSCIPHKKGDYIA
jgi:hypothetical protein